MEMAAEWNRYFLLEDARSIAQTNYDEDPFDADNLTRWGSVLLQLSHFQNGEDGETMIEDAILKLEEALVYNPIKHDALWLLGNCFANQAFLASDLNEINGYKDKAAACYQKALHEDPGNENYIRSFELFSKAPEMEKDILANANMDKDTITNGEMNKCIQTNGDMDKEIHTDAEIDKDIHTHAETEEEIHTNALAQQFIGDASLKAELLEFLGSVLTDHVSDSVALKKAVLARSRRDSPDLYKMPLTLLEVTRASHKEIERLIVKNLQNEPASSKDRLFQSHRVQHMIDTITTTTEKVIDIYEDKDNARKDEIATLGGQTATGTNVFSAFYDRLKEIREYHRKLEFF